LLQHWKQVLIAFGPTGVLVLALLDSLGVPLPGAMDFVVVSVSWNAPHLAWLTALLAVIGSMGGNVGLFLVCRYGGRRFVKPPEPGDPQKFRRWFHRYGLVTVFIPALLPIPPLPLKVFVVSAGVLHTPLRRFFAVVLAARAIRYGGEAYMGVKLGENGAAFLQHNAWTFVIVTLALAAALVAFIKWNDRRRELAQPLQ